MTVQCEIIIVKAPIARPTIAGTGSILFISNPPGAEIFLSPINEIPVSTNKYTPVAIENLNTEDYEYILKLSGYNDHSNTITVIADQVITVNVDLIQKSRPEILLIFIVGGIAIKAIIDSQRKLSGIIDSQRKLSGIIDSQRKLSGIIDSQY